MRDEVTNKTVAKYQAWVGRNAAAGLEVIDIAVSEKTTHAPAQAWDPLLACSIVVKFYGRAIP